MKIAVKYTMPAKTARLYGLEPPPKRLSRKRLIKLLMSYKVPRNFAEHAVKVGVEALGSYAAVWSDIIDGFRKSRKFNLAVLKEDSV